MKAWYNNKAVRWKQQTKSEWQLQKVSWKLNNALYKTLEDSESKSRNYLRSQAEDSKICKLSIQLEYRKDNKPKGYYRTL